MNASLDTNHAAPTEPKSPHLFFKKREDPSRLTVADKKYLPS